MATILIIEDELLIAEEIAYMLESMGHTALEPVSSSDAALEVLRTQFVELVLMDINIEGDTDGIATAVLVRRLFAVPVVFLTALSDPGTLNRAKLAKPYGYIVKPFTEHTVRAQLELALFNAYSGPDASRPAPAPAEEPTDLMPVGAALPESSYAQHWFVRKGTEHVKVQVRDMLYFEAKENYVQLYTSKGDYLFHSTLKELEQKLPAAFVKTHRSYIVNLDQVQSYADSGIIMGSDVVIPVGRSYKEELRRRFQLLG